MRAGQQGSKCPQETQAASSTVTGVRKGQGTGDRDRRQGQGTASCCTENKPSVLNLGQERLGLDTRKLRDKFS